VRRATGPGSGWWDGAEPSPERTPKRVRWRSFATLAATVALAATIPGAANRSSSAAAAPVETRAPTAGSEAGVTESFESVEPTVTGTTYYVSGSGDDRNDGRTERMAFRTLQAAADRTRPGDQVLAMTGVYTSAPRSIVLDIPTAGEPDRYITYRAYPGHAPIVQVRDNHAGIRTTVPYVVIDGFTVQGDVPNLDGKRAAKRARGRDEDLALYAPLFTSNGIASYSEDGSRPHHLIIRNNHVFDLPGGGIFSNDSDFVRIEDNVVHDNCDYSPWANSGISVYHSASDDSSTGVKIWIRRNFSYRNENKVPFWMSNSDPAKRTVTDGNGIIIDDARHSQRLAGSRQGRAFVGGFAVEDNVLFDNGGRGLSVYQSDDVLARGNVMHGNGRSSGSTELLVYSAGTVRFEGNFVMASDDRSMLSTGDTMNVTYRDNVLVGGRAPYPGGPDNIECMGAACRYRGG
jgi:hypothetical protein